jgi:DNA-binding NarL/FixJ family response regulator
LRKLLEAKGDCRIVRRSGDGEETLKLARERKPDILLLDLTMPRRTGFDALREFVKLSTLVRTILLAAAVEKVQLVAAIQLN